jgi:hypothetical protein
VRALRRDQTIPVENINDLMLLHHIDIVSRRPRGVLQRREMTDIQFLPTQSNDSVSFTLT